MSKKLGDYNIKFRKKGKTRGRPSKVELLMSCLASRAMKGYENDLNKAVEDLVMYGYAVIDLGLNKEKKWKKQC